MNWSLLKENIMGIRPSLQFVTEFPVIHDDYWPKGFPDQEVLTGMPIPFPAHDYTTRISAICERNPESYLAFLYEHYLWGAGGIRAYMGQDLNISDILILSSEYGVKNKGYFIHNSIGYGSDALYALALHHADEYQHTAFYEIPTCDPFQNRLRMPRQWVEYHMLYKPLESMSQRDRHLLKLTDWTIRRGWNYDGGFAGPNGSSLGYIWPVIWLLRKIGVKVPVHQLKVGVLWQWS